jgi:hypothetical protein
MSEEKIPLSNAVYRSRVKSRDFTGDSIRYYIRNRKNKSFESHSLDGLRGYAKPMDDLHTRFQFTIEGFPLPNPDQIDDTHDTTFIVKRENLDLDKYHD